MIEQKIQEVREFIEDNRKGKSADSPVFWSVHVDSSMYKINRKSTTVGKNYEFSEMGDSFDLLDRCIRRAANQGHRYLMVCLRSSSNDSNPIEFPFENPVKQNNSAVAGFNQNQGIGTMEIMGLMQNQFHQQMQMNQKMQDLRMEQMRRDFEQKDKERELRETIAGLQHENEGGFLKKTLLPIVEGIAERYFVPGENPYLDEEEEQPDSPNNQTDQEQQDLIRQKHKDLTESLNRIKKHFPNINALMSDLATFIEQDPENAKFLVSNMSQRVKNG